EAPGRHRPHQTTRVISGSYFRREDWRHRARLGLTGFHCLIFWTRGNGTTAARVISIGLGDLRLPGLTDHFDDHLRDLARARTIPVHLGRQEMKDAVGQLASHKGIRPVETLSGREETLADLI